MRFFDKIWKWIVGKPPVCRNCGKWTHNLYYIGVCKECKDDRDNKRRIRKENWEKERG